jgi:hypothetical protein
MEQASQGSTKSKQRVNLQFPMRPKNPATGSTAAAAASLGTTASVGIETPKGTGSKLPAINNVHRTMEHSFLTDVADVRQMEQGLLQLLEDFHLGKLQAFGLDCTFEKMDEVRERQERLARKHFDIDSRCDSKGHQPPEASSKNLSELMGNLQELCQSIQNLQKDQASGHNQQ